MTVTGEPETRRGRPRSEACTTDILAATLDLVAEVGLGGFTVDAVAARAGVGKATIYRRWSSKEALMLDAWATFMPAPPLPDTGSLRTDVVAFMGALEAMWDEQQRRVFPQMIAAASVNPDVADRYAEFVTRRREPIQALLRRAVDRGELAADTDLVMLHDLLTAPLFYRWLVTAAPVDDQIVDRWVAMVLDGAAR